MPALRHISGVLGGQPDNVTAGRDESATHGAP